MLLVNVNTKQFIPSAGSNFIQPIESRDQVIYGTRVEIRFQLYNPDGTVFALNESDTFCCAGDINFIHTDDLMFYAGHESCRIIDAEHGLVGVIIDATSDSFADKATSQNTRMYVQLKRHVAGDTLGDTVLQDIVYAQPAVMTTEGAPASSDPEYMTAAATLALLRTAPDFQFSVDGESGWHDEQDIAADRFYRERRNGGEWGPAIELIEGKTGEAAGFGTPTIAVESLPAGSNATASVTASGDDTAKEFNFNFGIPKGADGAAGADGVSSYTYVAYASDASGAGFSLTPSNALPFRAEIHTTTAIETPDAADFAGATWVKYLGNDGGGAGDMLKSVYDTNDDGIVDHAATADTVGSTTAAQVADAVSKAHAHANKATLDKLAETGGKLTFDGSEIGGGSGTVKSVNGQLPDESGNVTIETGGAVAVSNPANGDIPCFDATATIGGGNDETVKFLLQPATTDGELIDSAAGAVTPATITNQSLTVSESGEIEFSSSKYATVPASGILADVLRHDKSWVFDLLVYLDQTSSQSRFFGTESGGDFFCQWTGDYGFDFKYGDTWISTVTGNVGEWNLLTLEYYQKNGTWHVALYLQGVLCQDKEISTSFDPKTSELAIGRSTSGSYLCSGKIRAIRIREGALYNGQSFTPDEFPYQEPQTVGEWGKLNKSLLAMKSDVLPEWRQLSGSSAITLDRGNGELQKVTLTQNCTLTAPILSAANPTLLLQVTSSSAVTVTVGETNIVTDHTGTFQVGWFYDGETTRRYPVVEVA